MDFQNFTANDAFDAILVMADGTTWLGKGLGAYGVAKGEVCFNVSMTGYQEILTDPSYAGQIITFTFPHIGNVGCNLIDLESRKVFCHGLILREAITPPSNHRSQISLSKWLKDCHLTGISGVDTRHLTRKISREGPQNVLICHVQKGEKIDRQLLLKDIQKHPPLKGMQLAYKVSVQRPYRWSEGLYKSSQHPISYTKQGKKYHVVVIDYGTKRNILRHLIENHFQVTVVPSTACFEDILQHRPDGILLSNGPGDPFATCLDATQKLITSILNRNIPLFGICLGSQLLALVFGLKTLKLHSGHQGANHPVKNLKRKYIEITSQNHCFYVSKKNLPEDIEITHVSLFDGTIEGIRHKRKPAFAVQYHPESSPGPHDSHYLFKEFYAMIEQSKKNSQIDK